MTSQQAARMEIKQELGYRVKRLHRLGQFCPDSAVMSSTLDLFLAELTAGPRHDEPEGSEAFGKIHRLTLAQLVRKIRDGEIRDSYTIGALLFAQIKGLVQLDAR
jgi:ADP-ribose pyrophosphatase